VKVGVLALQGAFDRHAQALSLAGAAPLEVRGSQYLEEIDALVIPGGESTTMMKLAESLNVRKRLMERIEDGLPVLGTCAGMILLSKEIFDGRDDQHPFGSIDIGVRRNGYGRQLNSFEEDLKINDFDTPFRGVFIRAPLVERIGNNVEVLASVEGHPVFCREGKIMVTSFHPELVDDDRVHRLFLETAFASN
jgi:5'-phosphate synthase pdxT subunit|tara:strand:- start:1811 stop:2389 length:579 start_codon:yes stop_codon:yes gene_type:complete